MRKRVAIVLQNLGAPDSLEAVRPFLYNLFSDPAILAYPCPFRQFLAWIIARLRYKKAGQIYARMGGASPLLGNTQIQAEALKAELEGSLPENEVGVFIAMRYWHPFTQEAAQNIEKFNPDHVIVLPLYPQFSTTTSGSSIAIWQKVFGEKVKSSTICCYPKNPGFIKAYQDLIAEEIAKVLPEIPLRLLFSAHGLPQKIIDQGDPYAFQVKQTVEAVMAGYLTGYDYQICYQSRVGPLQWLGPSLDQAIKKAANDKKGVILVPISFVSEHSETLVELDIDFKARAKDLKLPYYGRVPTVSDHPDFIKGLAEMVLHSVKNSGCISRRNCQENHKKCWGL